MKYYLLIPLSFILLGIIGAICESRKQMRKQALKTYLSIEKRCVRAIDSHSLNKVRNAIREWEVAYHEAEPILEPVFRRVYEQDMKDLKANLACLEEDHWLRKAEKYLDSFSMCYELIMDGQMENFKDVEELFRLKKRCISAWQNYFSIDLTEYESTIYPKRYLREYMGELYDPCMESHEALEKKLSERIQIMRPEYKRKMQLYELIVSFVWNNVSVLRTELLRKPFDGFTPEEVKCCYNALLKKNRLMEYKMGGRVFAMASDKECSKPQAHKQKEEPQKMIVENNTLIHDMLIRHFLDHRLEYVDLTDRGGSLYFFDEATSKELAEKGYEVHYAQNGTKNTSNRPAWYISIK